eukprot:scaffold202475_cov17-Prasinocladus_malaysianus.AAC.1
MTLLVGDGTSEQPLGCVIFASIALGVCPMLKCMRAFFLFARHSRPGLSSLGMVQCNVADHSLQSHPNLQSLSPPVHWSSCLKGQEAMFQLRITVRRRRHHHRHYHEHPHRHNYYY